MRPLVTFQKSFMNLYVSNRLGISIIVQDEFLRSYGILPKLPSPAAVVEAHYPTKMLLPMLLINLFNEADYAAGPSDWNIKANGPEIRGPKDQKPWILESAFSWGVEPECRILMCMWCLGPLQMDLYMLGISLGRKPCCPRLSSRNH